MAAVRRPVGARFRGGNPIFLSPEAGGVVARSLFFEAAGSATDALVATDIVAPAPLLGAPALAQTQALAATDIVAPAPLLGAPGLAQTQALAATDIVAPAPVLGAPALTQTQALVATDIVAPAPVLGVPALVEVERPVVVPIGGRGRRPGRVVVRLRCAGVAAPAAVFSAPSLFVMPNDAQLGRELQRRRDARLRADDEDAMAALLAA